MKACQAALRIASALPLMGGIYATVAVASGRATCGNVGTEQLRSFQVFGDVVCGCLMTSLPM